MTSRNRTFIVILLAALAVTWLARRTRDTLQEPPQRVSRVWLAGGQESPALVQLIEERRRKVYHPHQRLLFSKTILYNRYILEARQLADGRVLGRQAIGDVEQNSGRASPEIVGVTGHQVWVWDGQLSARSLPDLAVTFPASSWAEPATALKDLLPAQADGFRVLPDGDHLVFRGRDARFYRIDAATGGTEVIRPELFPETTLSTRAEDRFVHFRSPHMSRITTSPAQLLQKSFRQSDGYWYALLSESELSTLSKWASANDRPYGEVARRFYRMPYEWDGQYAAPDKTRVETLGDVRLIQAGFLERDFGVPWAVPDPDSTLVVAKPQLGAEVPWELVRLAHDGRIVWRTSTQLAEIHEFLPSAHAVVVTGRRLPSSVGGSTDDRRDTIVTIDAVTGARHEFGADGADAKP